MSFRLIKLEIAHVPDLKRNLISLSTLDAKDKYTSEGGVLKISEGALVMMKGLSKDRHVICYAGFYYYKRCCHCISFIIRG